MSGELVVGRTTIPYAVRVSARARRKRIVVTPAGVEVVVPTGAEAEVAAYLHAKRRWVFLAVREMAAKTMARVDPRYVSGAKIQFRGRGLMLEVRPAEGAEGTVRFRSRFHVTVPAALEGAARAEAVREALDRWLDARAEADLQRLGAQYAARLGVTPAGYRLSDSAARWGSCGRDGVVRVHRRLVAAPVAVLEYVVAHEVTHLLHRNHSAAFWHTLGRLLPDWEARKALLARWEGESRGV